MWITFLVNLVHLTILKIMSSILNDPSAIHHQWCNVYIQSCFVSISNHRIFYWIEKFLHFSDTVHYKSVVSCKHFATNLILIPYSIRTNIIPHLESRGIFYLFVFTFGMAWMSPLEKYIENWLRKTVVIERTGYDS